MVAEILILGDVVDYSKPIENHTFTIGWLLDSLRKNDKTFIKLYGNRAVKNVTAYDVSGGKGYLSVVLRCTLTFVDSIDDSDVYHTVLKIPGVESIEEIKNKLSDIDFEELEKKSNNNQEEFLINSHEFECEFYNSLAPILDVPCPKVFKTTKYVPKKDTGVLHMEDLTLRGKTISYFENINLTQVKALIRVLAKMHKNTLTCDPNLWEGKFLKNQEVFAKVAEAYDIMTTNLVKKSNRKEFVMLHEKLHKIATSNVFSLYANKQAYKDIGLPSILVHGDMHSGNIMWAIDAEGNIQNELAALVDWQIMHEGSPMSDLARFLTHCCDGVVRRQAESFAIEYYFECLTKEFGGDKSKIPFNIEQLKKAYNYSFIIQGFLSIAIADMFYISNEDRWTNETLKKAYYDYAVLKALHLYEDIDRLLEGEMKDMFEKYGI